MVQSLAEFLTTHRPDTDLRLLSWHAAAGDEVTAELEASPWWLGREARAGQIGKLRVHCRGVAECSIRLGWRATEVEDLEVTTQDPLLWAHGQHGAIYGNAPLTDPERFYCEFADLVHHTLRTGREVLEYFDGVSFSAWSQRVTTYSSYQLLSGPQPLLEACRKLLERRALPYSVTLGPTRAAAGSLQLVILGESWVICGDAAVEVSARTA